MIAKLMQHTLLQNTFIYTVLQLFNRGIPFLLLPILTRYLSPEDYGVLSIYNTLVGIFSIFTGLSLFGAVGVSFFQLEKEELKRYIGNVFYILSGNVFVVILIVILFESYLVTILKIPSIWLYIAIGVAWMQAVTAINLTLWRSEQRAKPFALYEIAQTVFNIMLSLGLIVILHYGWEGRAAGSAIANIVFGLLSLLIIFKRGYAVLRYSSKYIKDAFKFGVTLIPHQFASWIRSGIDIWLISMIVGVSATGLYSVGMQFGMVIGILASAFNNAYSPFLYEKLANMTQETKKKLVKWTYAYFLAIMIVAMVLSTFFVWLIPFFIGEKFQHASKYVYWISMAYAFQGMYLMVVNYIFYVKKNHLISMVTFSTSMIHIALSYILIKEYGAIGAAYASVASAFLTFLLIWRLSAQVVQMPWHLKVINDVTMDKR
jgi:O-antigen/teichoic acid export membrane protein